MKRIQVQYLLDGVEEEIEIGVEVFEEAQVINEDELEELLIELIEEGLELEENEEADIEIENFDDVYNWLEQNDLLYDEIYPEMPLVYEDEED